MDDFNNFFDDQRQNTPNDYIPVYHSPDPQQTPPQKKRNIGAIFCIAATVIMCLALVVNVVVLATLKGEIADKFAEKMSAQMRDQYSNAIDDALSDKDIIDDVIGQASDKAVENISKSIGELASEYCLNSTVIIECSSSDSSKSATASGFLISNSGSTNAQRYIVTNAHVVMYEKNTYIGYKFALFDNLYARFDGESTKYPLEIVSVGSYSGDNVQGDISKPDLAICRISSSTQPSDTAHPALKIAVANEEKKIDYAKIGSEAALIGNPAGIGLSITTGTVSKSASEYYGWPAGKYVMTDAAVNPGNSGGPMLNRQLAVIGVVESKIVQTDIDNMGFAVSAETLITFIEWSEKASNNKLMKNITIPFSTVVAV